MKIKAFLFIAMLAGCTGSNVRSNRHAIRCMNVVSRCHDKARDLCGDGYLVTNRVRPQRGKDGTEFLLKIRCRSEDLF